MAHKKTIMNSNIAETGEQETSLERTGSTKYLSIMRHDHINRIKEHISANPDASFSDVCNKFKPEFSHIARTVMNIFKNESTLYGNQKAEIAELLEENPSLSQEDVCRMMNIPRIRVSVFWKELKDQGHPALQPENKELIDLINDERIIDVFKKNPQKTVHDIAYELNLNKHYVNKRMSFIKEKIIERNTVSAECMRDWFFKQLEDAKLVCLRRLEGCTKPTQGARWIELFMKALNDQSRMMGTEAPSKHQVEIGIVMDKDQRDEVLKAAMARVVDGKLMIGEDETPPEAVDLSEDDFYEVDPVCRVEN